MNHNILVEYFGFPATLVHGDTLVLDRWNWIKKKIKPTKKSMKILDVGCGTGAFTIGLAKMGYYTLGLSWDERNQRTARERAKICNAKKAIFEIQDVRFLDERKDLFGKFDIVLCTENIEHILNDQKLMTDMAACLKTNGRLLLTTPNFNYIPITKEDSGPFDNIETGWHVRRGYKPLDFERLCLNSGFKINKIDYCSGFLSQKITFLWRNFNKFNNIVSFGIILPLRVLPPLIDKTLTKVINYPEFSICLDATKI